jgi:bla regulator protein BlaR1
MIGGWTNHLWQSTLFALAAGLLTTVFRKNRAKVRYWLWLTASFKFLIPLSLLISLGSRLEWAPAAKKIATQAVAVTMTQITQPFPDTWLLASPTPGAIDWAPVAILSVWACGFVAIAVIRLRGWLRIRAAVDSSTLLKLPIGIEVRSSPGLLEPGVVGLWRPILLLPAGIVERLTPCQLEAVLAHELCHIRRRDNLSAAIHMVVEALFWFHPLVWWIGARLMEERERACDEGVLQLGGEPRVYAEAILNVCKYYLESPLVCVSGITGADLKKRIAAIMTQHIAQNLSFTKKLLLSVGGIAVVVAPIVMGLVNVPASRAQSSAGRPQFEVASVKPSNSADRRPLFRFGDPGQFTAANVTVKMLIRQAYGIKLFQISGGPGWMDSDLFDIAAKPGGSADIDQVMPMLQSLLAERFQLVIRRDTREMAVYALVVAKNGPKFKESKESDPNIIDLGGRDNTAGAPRRPQVTKIRRGLLVAQEAPMAGFAVQLSDFLGRIVLDKTGLMGKYDLKLEWQPDENQVAMFQAMGVPEGFGAPAPDPMGPSVFAALQEQLGLKLESEKGPVELFVIERVERPSAN